MARFWIRRCQDRRAWAVRRRQPSVVDPLVGTRRASPARLQPESRPIPKPTSAWATQALRHQRTPRREDRLRQGPPGLAALWVSPALTDLAPAARGAPCGMRRRDVDDRPILAYRNAREAFTRFAMPRPSDGAVWSAVSTRSDSIVHRCPCPTFPFHPPNRRCRGGRRDDVTVAARTAPWYRPRWRRCGGTNWVWCVCAIAPRKWSRSDRRTIPSGGDLRYTPAPELDRRNTGDLRYGEPYL